ncbi:MAG: hypothetical protein ABI721_00875 [Candidatus Dojkabacteria bacterium]
MADLLIDNLNQSKINSISFVVNKLSPLAGAEKIQNSLTTVNECLEDPIIFDREIMELLSTPEILESLAINLPKLDEIALSQFLYILSEFTNIAERLKQTTRDLDSKHILLKLLKWGAEDNSFSEMINNLILGTPRKLLVLFITGNVGRKQEIFRYITHSRGFSWPFENIERILDIEKEQLEKFFSVFQSYFQMSEQDFLSGSDAEKFARMALVDLLYFLITEYRFSYEDLKRAGAILSSLKNSAVYINHEFRTPKEFADLIRFCLDNPFESSLVEMAHKLNSRDPTNDWKTNYKILFKKTLTTSNKFDAIKYIEFTEKLEKALTDNKVKEFFESKEFFDNWASYKQIVLTAIIIIVSNSPKSLNIIATQICEIGFELKENNPVLYKEMLKILEIYEGSTNSRIGLLILLINSYSRNDYKFPIEKVKLLASKYQQRLEDVDFIVFVTECFAQGSMLNMEEIIKVYNDLLYVTEKDPQHNKNNFSRILNIRILTALAQTEGLFLNHREIYDALIAASTGNDFKSFSKGLEGINKLLKLDVSEKNIIEIFENQRINDIDGICTIWELTIATLNKVNLKISCDVTTTKVSEFIDNFGDYICNTTVVMFLTIYLPQLSDILQTPVIRSLEDIRKYINNKAADFLLEDGTTYIPESELERKIFSKLLGLSTSRYSNGIEDILKEKQEKGPELPKGFDKPVPIYLPEVKNERRELEKNDLERLTNAHSKLFWLASFLDTTVPLKLQSDFGHLLWMLSNRINYKLKKNLQLEDLINQILNESGKITIQEALEQNPSYFDEFILKLVNIYSKQAGGSHWKKDEERNELKNVIRGFVFVKLIYTNLLRNDKLYEQVLNVEDHTLVNIESVQSLLRVLAHDKLENILGDKKTGSFGINSNDVNKDNSKEIDNFVSETFGIDTSNITLDEKRVFLNLFNFQSPYDLVNELREKYKSTYTENLREYWIFPSLGFWKKVAGTIGNACYQGKLDEETHVIAFTIASGKSVRDAILQQDPSFKDSINNDSNVILDEEVNVEGNYLLILDTVFNPQEPRIILRAVNPNQTLEKFHDNYDIFSELVKTTKAQNIIYNPKGILGFVFDGPMNASTNNAGTFIAMKKYKRNKGLQRMQVDSVITNVNGYDISQTTYSVE